MPQATNGRSLAASVVIDLCSQPLDFSLGECDETNSRMESMDERSVAVTDYFRRFGVFLLGRVHEWPLSAGAYGNGHDR